jgi:hypothetical protein
VLNSLGAEFVPQMKITEISQGIAADLSQEEVYCKITLLTSPVQLKFVLRHFFNIIVVDISN